MRYLLLTYITRPNGKIDESMTVTKKLKLRDTQTANVILDFLEQKVIKGSMGDKQVPKDWDRVVGYYYQFYANIIERLFEENGHANPHKADDADTLDQKSDS
jgi:hypothetical protein